MATKIQQHLSEIPYSLADASASALEIYREMLTLTTGLHSTRLAACLLKCLVDSTEVAMGALHHLKLQLTEDGLLLQESSCPAESQASHAEKTDSQSGPSAPGQPP